MRFIEVKKHRHNGVYEIFGESCFRLTPQQFMELHTNRENAQVFRDIGTYSRHEWIDDYTLDVEYVSKVLFMSFPVGLRLTLDPREKSIAFCTIGKNPHVTVVGCWKTRPVSASHTIVTLRQNVVVNRLLPAFLNISSVLKQRIGRAFEDLQKYACSLRTV